MKQTKMCVQCLKKPAQFYLGHVLVLNATPENPYNEVVLAGWCSRICAFEHEFARGGYVGAWAPEMGLRGEESQYVSQNHHELTVYLRALRSRFPRKKRVPKRRS